MLARHFLVFAAVSVLSLGVVACGDDDDAVSTAGGAAGSAGAGANGGSGGAGGSSAGNAGDGGSGGSGGSGMDSCTTKDECCDKNPDYCEVVEPPGPPGTSDIGGGDNIQAVNKILFGEDTTPDDSADKLGLDIDGVNSDATFGAHCTARAGGQNKKIRKDGENGVDNAFGTNIVPLLSGVLSGGLGTAASSAIAEGDFSIVIQIDGAETGKNAASVPATLFACAGQPDGSGANVAPPADGNWSTYKWNPFDEIPEGIAFDGWIVDGVFVSGEPKDIKLQLSIGGAGLELNIVHGTIMGTMNADNTALTKGVIAGALLTDELLGQLDGVLAAFGICDPAQFQSIIDSLGGFSDILYEGGEVKLDNSKECNAISIGLGFETTKSGLENVMDNPPGEDPCP